ncbi:MAG: hypothetical protein NTY05_14985 [Rhodocyclales bacterium]|nr:hypothetical protein [Rhodocyclales bacterium]
MNMMKLLRDWNAGAIAMPVPGDGKATQTFASKGFAAPATRWRRQPAGGRTHTDGAPQYDNESIWCVDRPAKHRIASI